MKLLHMIFCMTTAAFAPLPAAAQSVAKLGPAISTATLEQARGGSTSMQVNASLRGSVSGNSASQVVTGANTIQASSFAGAAGIPIVIQNSGANVLIQNATVIQLQLK